jgi:hypothetical protein
MMMLFTWGLRHGGGVCGGGRRCIRGVGEEGGGLEDAVAMCVGEEVPNVSTSPLTREWHTQILRPQTNASVSC